MTKTNVERPRKLRFISGLTVDISDLIFLWVKMILIEFNSHGTVCAIIAQAFNDS